MVETYQDLENIETMEKEEKTIEERIKELQREEQNAIQAIEQAKAYYNQVVGAIAVLNEMK